MHAKETGRGGNDDQDKTGQEMEREQEELEQEMIQTGEEGGRGEMFSVS